MNPQNFLLSQNIFLQDLKPITGGETAHCWKVIDRESRAYFLKYYAQETAAQEEARGLKEIARYDDSLVPEVIAEGSGFLLLPWLQSVQETPERQAQLGEKLAQLHLESRGSQLGWSHDNFIGQSAQLGGWHSYQGLCSWVEFYRHYRLEPQLQWAKERGLPASFVLRIERLIGQLEEFLDCGDHYCCLLHGDLWAGNYLYTEDGGAYLIDPAPYYGHREADLAMTFLFGGFGEDFYRAYQDFYALKPGYQKRFNLYNTYHLLNHFNIFGASYLPALSQNLDQFLKM